MSSQSEQLVVTERKKWVKELGEVSKEAMNANIFVQSVQFPVGVIIERIVTDCANKSLDAGLGGCHHDGGARALMGALKAWIAGIERETPPEFSKVMLALHKENNPEEYEQYLHLKKIYGD